MITPNKTIIIQLIMQAQRNHAHDKTTVKKWTTTAGLLYTVSTVIKIVTEYVSISMGFLFIYFLFIITLREHLILFILLNLDSK